MTRTTHRTILTVALVACLALAGLAAPVAAQTDQDGISGVFDDSDTDDSSMVETVLALASGISDRARNYVSALASDTSADDAATDATQAFNSDAAARTSWANARTSASTDADVLKLVFEVDDKTATRYVVADVNGSDYQNVSMVTSTDRTADETCTLEGSAAREAGEEIDRFDEQFVADGTNVTRGYLTKMGAKYGGSVDCSFSVGGSS